MYTKTKHGYIIKISIGGMIIILYYILIAIIIVSLLTGIVTTILEKKELNLQRKKSFEGNYEKRNQSNSSMSEVLTKTLELSSITKKVDQIDLSSTKITNKKYYEEPVIVAIVDDETI